MKIHTTYECEICGSRYKDAESAEICEGEPRGIAYPVGLMHSNADPDDLYGPRHAFAVAECVVGGHSQTALLWACRDTGFGDSLGEMRCGDGNSYRPTEFDPRWLAFPPFTRLRKYLESAGITPLVWKDGKAIHLSEAVAGKVAAS